MQPIYGNKNKWELREGSPVPFVKVSVAVPSMVSVEGIFYDEYPLKISVRGKRGSGIFPKLFDFKRDGAVIVLYR